MKLAFSTLACPRWSIEQVVENAVRLGYDGIELRLLDGEVIDPVKDAIKVRQAIALARDNGIDVCTLDTSCRFNQHDPQVREAHLTDLFNWIDLAHEQEVPILRVFGGAVSKDLSPQPSEEQQNEWMIDALRRGAERADPADVIVALETHDAFSSALRVRTILQGVNSPSVAALWDSQHPYRVGESVEQILEALDGHIAHVHVKDARKPAPGSSVWELVLMGEGDVPVREILAALKKQNYDGYVSVEWEKKWHPEIPEPEVALPQHITWLKSALA
ncbi:MAG TPA: sugar phosphate isomerase/epimerase family protein [Ktedonosporobacter sp.]|nr:sugar phosphate isomerase/epimerase family protein [Ktedonosporobacter sp.]